MDIESPFWDQWESRFNQVAGKAQRVADHPDIRSARHHLCLYGENGFSPEEELQELEAMAQCPPDQLKKVEVDTGYWHEVVLFVP